MLQKTMIALCAMASIGMLAPDMALARGGGGHGGGGGGGGGGWSGGGGGGWSGGGGRAAGGGWGSGSLGTAHAAVGTNGVSARSFAAAPTNSFARAAPNGGVATGAVQGNRFASGNFGRGFDHGHGFHHHHGRFFVGDGFFFGPDGYDYGYYPDYAYDDTYYDNGSCYIVQRRVHTRYGWRLRPVQVCG